MPDSRAHSSAARANGATCSHCCSTARYTGNSLWSIDRIGSSDRPISLKELADLVIFINGNPRLEIRYAGDFAGTDRHADREIHRRYCSGDKARRLLGFSPRTSLEDGIRRIIDLNSIFEKWESTELPYLVDEMT